MRQKSSHRYSIDSISSRVHAIVFVVRAANWITNTAAYAVLCVMCAQHGSTTFFIPAPGGICALCPLYVYIYVSVLARLGCMDGLRRFRCGGNRKLLYIPEEPNYQERPILYILLSMEPHFSALCTRYFSFRIEKKTDIILFGMCVSGCCCVQQKKKNYRLRWDYTGRWSQVCDYQRFIYI